MVSNVFWQIQGSLHVRNVQDPGSALQLLCMPAQSLPELLALSCSVWVIPSNSKQWSRGVADVSREWKTAFLLEASWVMGKDTYPSVQFKLGYS